MQALLDALRAPWSSASRMIPFLSMCMFPEWQIWLIVSSFVIFFSTATPILKGDEKPGEMFGLDSPLGTKFWLSPMCPATRLQYEKTKRKYLTKKKNRPPGWEKTKLQHGEFVLDRTLDEFSNSSSGLLYCPFLTAACCKTTSLFKINPVKKEREDIPYVSFTVPQDECRSAPDIPLKSWGTCAFVAQGTSLRRVPRGHEIDQSDTIIRLGHMPLKGWEKYTGTRTDVVIGRGSIQTKYARDYSHVKVLIGFDKARKTYMTESDSVTKVGILDATTRNPKQISLNSGETVTIGSLELPGLLYNVMTKPINQKKRGPTTGFHQVLNILLSGFCQSLHIYGTTPNCGGYYHKIDYLMKVHHSCELESWALHYLMRSSKTNLCVWI